MLGDLLDPVHLVVLLVIALLIFGPKRLPEIGSGIGKAIRGYKDTMNGLMEDDPHQPPPQEDHPSLPQ